MEELREPTLLQTLRSHRSEVTCADASGAWLATGGADRSLRLWRWARGGWREAARAPAAHRHGVTAARLGGAGALLASGGGDGAVRVWGGAGGRPLAPRRLLLAPGAAAARALCWAARARLLAGHDDGALCVWHVPGARLLARLRAHEGALHAVAAAASGALLLTACTHGVLKVFDLAEVCRSGTDGSASPAPLTWVDGAHDMGVLCADATEDGTLAATGGHDALICVWRPRLELGEARGMVKFGDALEGHAAAVTALRWSGGAAGATLASASLDRTARVWVSRADSIQCVHVVHAHPRYLTCVALAHDLRYMITGSNDKSVRMWSMGSLTLDHELEPPCTALAHFALGDLQGIGPVDGVDMVDDGGDARTVGLEVKVGGDTEGGGSQRVWHEVAHAGAINCIATHEDLVATASSDGSVRVFRWSAGAGVLDAVHVLDAHQYPAMAVEFTAGGTLLLTAGLDGRACVWDVESGVRLRALSVPVGRGEAGGGGVRGARAAPRGAPLLLLATDDGLAPLWSLAASDPQPMHVYGGHTEAVTCCAWSWDGRVAASGAASGELRLYAPPQPRLLHHDSHAHDLGVQSCDFAPFPSTLELPDDTYLLATAGCDSLIKLWIIEYKQEVPSERCATVRAVLSLAAHGGGVASVRWSGALLASAGADHWARVWRASGAVPHASGAAPHASGAAPHASGGGVALRLLAAAPVAGAGGPLAVALLGAAPLLVTGGMGGELAVWELPPEPDSADEPEHDEEGTSPNFWSNEGVARWLQENVTRSPSSRMSHEEEGNLLRRSQEANITGSRLLADPLDALLEEFGYGAVMSDQNIEESKSSAERAAVRLLLGDELGWLRRAPPSLALEQSAPHNLLCPLSHRLLREPARAADGYTYERANILDWFIAADGAVSPVSGRRLSNARVLPNYAARMQLRMYLLQHTL